MKILVFVIAFVFCGIFDMKQSEYSYERADLTNGSHIMIIHNSNCPCHKGIFKPTANKTNFRKAKHYIYCPCCWEVDEIKQMNLYSKANCMGAIDWDKVETVQDVDAAQHLTKIMDPSNRAKTINYALQGDKLVPFDASSLPQKYKYVLVWD